MKKYHLHTTLLSKHWELLNKFTEKFGTHQKVLELALESMGKQFEHKANPALSQEDEIRMHIMGEMEGNCLIPRDGLKMLIELIDLEKFQEMPDNDKYAVQITEYNYQKPFKKLSLKEAVDGMIFAAKLGNWFDAANYTDDGQYYTMKITHSLGISGSIFTRAVVGRFFERYGAKTESEISEKNIFIKIYKSDH